MKSRNTWLHTAVRAHRAKTLDHFQRTQHAQEKLLEAEQQRDIAAQDLNSLRQDWTRRRNAASPSQQIDALYSRFYCYLSDKNLQAEHAQQASRIWMDAATVELRQSHAIQRSLEKVAKQRAEDLRQQAGARELQANAEAWLLGRAAMKPFAALDPQAAISEIAPVIGGLQKIPRRLT